MQIIKIYQICYSEETARNIPEGLLFLDNIANPRPDWREYWPIRRFLLSNELDEDTYYGFFSPKFCSKTGLSSKGVIEFISQGGGRHDVYTFSPFWDLAALFLNIYEQADFFHGDLKLASRMFVEKHHLNIDVDTCVTHGQNTVFCNYMVGNSKFWKAWLNLAEKLYIEAEEGENELSKVLNRDTNYGESRLPVKIFLMERIATTLLLSDRTLSNKAYDTFLMPSSATPFNRFRGLAIASDALKLSYDYTGNPSYLNEFGQRRNELLRLLASQ
jgi:hypothetical protein